MPKLEELLSQIYRLPRPDVERRGYLYEAACGGLSLRSRFRTYSAGIHPRAGG